MTDLRYTLVADGSSDRALLYHLNWLLREHLRLDIAIQSNWADFSLLRHRPQGLAQRIARAIELYPCDLLFIHRDAEAQDPEVRYEEVRRAIVESEQASLPGVCVVPVRMQEAWLLFNEDALRMAADNPNGTVQLEIPRLRDLEQVADPKELLHGLLRTASELSGRKLRKFPHRARSSRIAELIDDFTPLRELSAFRQLEGDLIKTLQQHDWAKTSQP